MKITANYRAVDGYSERRTYKTLRGAARFCAKWLGTQFDTSGPRRGVTFFGAGTVTIDGCPIPLQELVAMATVAVVEAQPEALEALEAEEMAEEMAAEESNERHLYGPHGFEIF